MNNFAVQTKSLFTPVTNTIPINKIKTSENGHIATIFDKDDRVICQIDDRSNLERWWKYDYNGNVISFHDSNDFSCSLEYDEKGNILKSENSDGMWYEQEFDDNGQLIHYTNHKGVEFFKEYDALGRCNYYKNLKYNLEFQYHYNKDGTRIITDLNNCFLI